MAHRASVLRSGLPLLAGMVLLPFLLAGCVGYYPSWHYAPGTAIHELHFAQEGEATIRVAARIVGILRPVDGLPRRVHVLLEVENRDTQKATLDPNLVRLTPDGALALAPESGVVAEFAPGERRAVEVFFQLPDPVTLPNVSLLELELSWSVRVGERELPSKARFFRASRWYGDPYYYDPWGYPYGWPYHGPYYWGPYWGPYWGYGASFSYSTCR